MKPFHIFFVTDGKDGQGFTIENVVLMFLSFNALPAKITKILQSVLTGEICLVSSS